MDLQERMNILEQLRLYMAGNDVAWQNAKIKAGIENGWFISEFVELAIKNITEEFLDADKLKTWTNHYYISNPTEVKTIGLVMAGNIPLVGFHDFLCIFVSGHKQKIKASSKDETLIKHLVNFMVLLNPEVGNHVVFSEMLKDCDAYIATGSNNSGRYFDYYFGRFPNIIRRNRTSVAILTGKETSNELKELSKDVHQYFGLGCRNISKIFVPTGYDFVPLLNSFKEFESFQNHHKYKNNYDYQLSIILLNNLFYMTDGTTLLLENENNFSPISQLNYQFYKNANDVVQQLQGNEEIQCIVGHNYIPFGQAQKPSLFNYADGVDTMQFLLSL